MTLSAKITRLQLACATLGTLLEMDRAYFAQNALDALAQNIAPREQANLALSQALHDLMTSPELVSLDGSLLERLEVFLQAHPSDATTLRGAFDQLKQTIEHVYPELLTLSAVVQNNATHYGELLFAAMKGPDADSASTYNRTGKLCQEG